MSQLGAYSDHIKGFVVTCPNGCFEPVWRAPANVKPADRDAWQDAIIPLRAHLDHRKCKRCKERVSVEAIWADAAGNPMPGAPPVVPKR